MDLFGFYPEAQLDVDVCEFWFLKIHLLTMADERRSFQFLDINETQKIGHCHLEHSHSMTLAFHIKCNNKQF